MDNSSTKDICPHTPSGVIKAKLEYELVLSVGISYILLMHLNYITRLCATQIPHIQPRTVVRALYELE